MDSKAKYYLHLVEATDESLREHDEKYHPDGYMEGDACKLRDGMEKDDKSDSLTDVDADGGNSYVTPEEDAAYLEAVKNGDMETASNMIRDAAAKACPGNKVVDKKGLPLVLYHGTPSGGFTKFKYPTAYLSTDKSYADRYQSPSASSIRFGKSASNPMTMKVFLLSDHLFDTRKAADRRTFFDRYVQGGEEWNPVSGLYTKLSKKGLPDWTEGEALADFMRATRRKNDAIIVDEGGYFDLEGNVVDRGISYVALDTRKIKSADPVTYDDDGNVIPLSRRFDDGDDIRGKVK